MLLLGGFSSIGSGPYYYPSGLGLLVVIVIVLLLLGRL